MTRYILYWIPFWLVVILRYPLAFIGVLLFQKDNRLTSPFNWLNTIDNDLLGDEGWKTEHLWPSKDPNNWFNKVRWLWRNGGNRFNYYVIGVSFDRRPAWAFWTRKTVPLFAGRFLDCRFGWSDYQLQGRCKYVFTVRIKTKP